MTCSVGSCTPMEVSVWPKHQVRDETCANLGDIPIFEAKTGEKCLSIHHDWTGVMVYLTGYDKLDRIRLDVEQLRKLRDTLDKFTEVS